MSQVNPPPQTTTDPTSVIAQSPELLTALAPIFQQQLDMTTQTIQNTIAQQLAFLSQTPAHAVTLESLNTAVTPASTPPVAAPDTITDEFHSDWERDLAALWSTLLKQDITEASADFFQLGGNSLLAMQLVLRIRDQFGLEVPLSQVFELSHLDELAEWLQQQHISDHLPPPIQPQASDTPLQLSFVQQRLWFLAQLEGNSATYNIPIVLRITGKFNAEQLRQALIRVVARQQSLRLCFPSADGQASVAELSIYDPLTVTDLRAFPPSEQAQRSQDNIQQHAAYVFDIATDPLFRAELLQLSDTQHILLFNLHHIIADGWSKMILQREWTAFYGNPDASLPALPICYTDYAAWQRDWLQGKTLQKQLAYWQQQLTGAPELLSLPTDFPRPALQSYRGSQVQAFVSTELTQLHAFAKQQHCTLFMVLLAAFNVLLYRYTGQADILVGSPVANRNHHQQVEDLIGFFANTLVFRSQFPAHISFQELLQQTRDTTLAAYAHQDTPFEQLIETLNPKRSLSYAPLFQVLLVLHNMRDPADYCLAETQMLISPQENATAKFDLTLNMREQAEGLHCIWEYATDLFSQATIERLAQHFDLLLAQLLRQPELPVSQHDFLTAAERIQLQQWNATEVAYPTAQTLVDLFAQQVEATPNQPALRFQAQVLSYRELNEKANQVAHLLNSQYQIQANSLVGLCVERSLEMVIGLLGILKAGGAYVPLDPSYPQERLAWMLSDSEVSVLLTQTGLQANLPAHQATVLCLDHWDLFATQPRQDLTLSIQPEQLAYVIYTSGSTGRPKGVLIEHKGLVNLALAQIQCFDIDQHSQVLQFASISFDAAVSEIATSLLSGACLWLPTKAQLLENFTEFSQSITHLTLSPSYLSSLPEHALPKLQTLVVAGEASPLSLLQHWANKGRLLNAYGPTEATVCASFAECSPQQSQVTIGQPLANTRIYMLDPENQVTPIGIAGELCIAGIGLARGYLNRPKLSAAKFIELDVLGKKERLYKTGDLARWLADGQIEYLGRIDHQVKLRGFRIELGEIEAVLTQQSIVKEAAVVVHGQGEERLLVAYLVLADDTAQVYVLRDLLKQRLPDFMMPNHFVALTHLPLTPNGKVDRNALSTRPLEQLATTAVYTAPRNALEQQLVTIWSKVLKRAPDSVSIHSNFFDLGGHSMLAVRLLAQIEKHMGHAIAVTTLFQAPTVAQLAATFSQTATEEQAVQVIQAQGHHPPLFFFGAPQYARALSNAMGAEQPFYGLNIFAFETVPDEALNMPLVAHRFAQEMKQIQPQGPYYLCAYCADTRIALALAHHLAELGDDIAFFGVIDLFTWQAHRWQRHYASLQRFGVKYVFYKVRTRFNFSLLTKLMLIKLVKLFHRKSASSSLPEQLKTIEYISRFETARQAYALKPYQGFIDFFLSEDVITEHSEQFARLGKTGSRVHPVEGFHLNLFEEPYLSKLAAELQTQIRVRKIKTRYKVG